MKLVIVGHPMSIDIIENVLNEHIKNMSIESIQLVDETQLDSVAEKILKKEPSVDGIIFTGKIPYKLILSRIPSSKPWVYIDQNYSQLQKTLLKTILHTDYDIKNISVDSYKEETVIKAYSEIGLDNITYQIASQNIYDKNYLNKTTEFHKENHQSKKSLCITGISTIYNQLKKENIPVMLLKPTADTILQTYYLLLEKGRSIINEASQIVVFSIEPDVKSEYDLVLQNEYQYLLQRNKIHEVITLFAQKLQAAVVDTGDKYMLFSTRNVVSIETDNFKTIKLLTDIHEDTSTTVSIGIGIGPTAREAKYQAIRSMKHASKMGGNQCFMCSNDKMHPLTHIKGQTKDTSTHLTPIADQTGLGIKTLYKLYCLVSESQMNRFTSSDLADYLNITSRSMNRILQKLENNGYVEMIGKATDGSAGRPKRVLKLNLQK